MKRSGLSRDTIDKFYTTEESVKLCIKMFSDTIKVTSNSLCVEPSAGNGAFIDSIKRLFSNRIFYDLKPEHDEIIEQDFMSVDYNAFHDYDTIHVLGNPPFGRQSSTAIKFIKYASQFANTISFILPKSFKKESMRKHFPCNFHLVTEMDLPSDSFTMDGKIHNIPCIFQIWEKRETKRKCQDKVFPVGYSFTRKSDGPNIAIRRVGVYAGSVYTEIENKSPQSHYFIKFDNGINNHLLHALSNISYPNRDYTVGPRSLSKPDIIVNINRIMLL